MSEPDPNPIVLSGCGWVTPVASGPIDVVLPAAAACQGLGGLEEADHHPSRSGKPQGAAEVDYWDVPDTLLDGYGGLPKELKRDKLGRMTAVAWEHARRDAGLEECTVASEHTGLIVGCALAGQLGMIQFAEDVRDQTARFVSPIHFPQTVGNYLAGALARAYGIRGANATLSSGPASGLDAIVEGCNLLDSGCVEVVFAGGSDRLSQSVAAGLAKPGVVLSEGACLFVLERRDHAAKRGACPLATVRRFARTFDEGAGTEMQPEGEGDRAREAGNIEASLPLPHVPGSDWRFGPAHGDLVSTAACHHPGGVLIEHWIGRSMGAAGAAAVGAAIGAARGQRVPIVDASDTKVVRVSSFSPGAGAASEPGGSSGGATHAVIVASSDSAHKTILELLVHPRS